MSKFWQCRWLKHTILPLPAKLPSQPNSPTLTDSAIYHTTVLGSLGGARGMAKTPNVLWPVISQANVPRLRHHSRSLQRICCVGWVAIKSCHSGCSSFLEKSWRSVWHLQLANYPILLSCASFHCPTFGFIWTGRWRINIASPLPKFQNVNIAINTRNSKSSSTNTIP